jgi:anti-sigma factor RsiW
MTQTPSFRDVEKLSAYLDGQLKPSEITRLESRLQSDPQLASVLRDLRQARGLLRQLPQRRAPRNFTLTPQMVGQKPPLPRSYPIFRFATALATLLLFFTFATNFMAPRLVRTAAPYPVGIGGYGGGGGPESEMTMESAEAAPEQQAAPALAAPAATEPPVEAPAAPPVPLPTEMPPSAEDSARVVPEATVQPSQKSGVQAPPSGEALAQQAAPNEAEQAQKPARPISAAVQVVLAGIAVLSGLVALLLRIFALRQWRAKTK